MGSVNDPNNDRHRLEKRMEDVKQLPEEEGEVLGYFADNYGDKYAESTLERPRADPRRWN